MKTSDERVVFMVPKSLKDRFIFCTRRHGEMSKLLREFVEIYCDKKEGRSRLGSVIRISKLLNGEEDVRAKTDS